MKELTDQEREDLERIVFADLLHAEYNAAKEHQKEHLARSAAGRILKLINDSGYRIVKT